MHVDDRPELRDSDLMREPKRTPGTVTPVPEKRCDATAIYLREIGAGTLLNQEEERDLALRAKQGDFEARQRMIRCNLRLVVKIARHYMNHGMDLLDLIEEGNLGRSTPLKNSSRREASSFPPTRSGGSDKISSGR